MSIEVGSTYRHYKGGRYRVLALARLSEDRDQRVVVYQSEETGETWVRPLRPVADPENDYDCWDDEVTWPTHDRAPRFVPAERTAGSVSAVTRPDDPPPPYCPHGVGDYACGDRDTCARLWRAGRRDERPYAPGKQMSKGGTNMRAAGESPVRVEEQSALPGNSSDESNGQGDGRKVGNHPSPAIGTSASRSEVATGVATSVPVAPVLSAIRPSDPIAVGDLVRITSGARAGLRGRVLAIEDLRVEADFGRGHWWVDRWGIEKCSNEAESPRAKYDEAQRVGPYRVGSKLGRTLYRDDVCIGMIDDAETARFLAAAANCYVQSVAPVEGGVRVDKAEAHPGDWDRTALESHCAKCERCQVYKKMADDEAVRHATRASALDVVASDLRDELRRWQHDCRTYEALARDAQAKLDAIRTDYPHAAEISTWLRARGHGVAAACVESRWGTRSDSPEAGK